MLAYLCPRPLFSQDIFNNDKSAVTVTVRWRLYTLTGTGSKYKNSAENVREANNNAG